MMEAKVFLRAVMRRLIINADDFGLDRDTVDATIELIERGLVTSATLLLCGKEIDRAIDFAIGAGDACSFGLHFNIVDGAMAKCPSSLTDQVGQFRPSMMQRRRALLGRLLAADIEKEFVWQAYRLRDRGIRISHVDSHGHLHKWPSVAQVIAPLLGRLEIGAMRRPQNLYFRHRPLDLLDAYCTWRFPRVRTTEHYCAVDPHESDWLNLLSSLLPDGTVELSVHPGKTEPWRRWEFEPLIRAGPCFFWDNGIQLINFHQLVNDLNFCS
ncbi:ChbG/HpnK family deacetylase [Bradyrhizobium vignae]|uniref:ChbG/HpnK family deacetylase n=1 Tax=Bradyrhizobium vignae TaxID=1549949 RepID=UPI00100B3B77|nr:ChbG/HpnK family deacetylase [Bradyrhizobium vignae]RXG85998.1 ChbG/HpnK family deacetylase [Bradyrhizobium vignae]